MKKIHYDRYEDRDVYMYVLGDDKLSVGVVDLGARLNFIKVNGVDIALGFDSVEDYLRSATYAGATIGRVANRIARGKFELDGKAYELYINNGKNHLHGGKRGFDMRFFEVVSADDDKLVLRYTSEDGEEGYPGKLVLTVEITVENKSVNMKFTAVSDKTTLWNPTNHTYFNLNGDASGDSRGNILYLGASHYTPTDEGLIPTGEKRDVVGTPFDFNAPKAIGKDYGCSELEATNGYDHNFVLDTEYAATVVGEKSGIVMDLYTDMPCIQLYTAGGLTECRGKNGAKYSTWQGFCLEPQFCPNAINMTGFDKPVLKAGETSSHYIRYTFE